MVEFEVLGTDKELDASDPTGSAMSFATVVAGAAALFVALPVGQQIANWAMNQAASAADMSIGDADPGVTFGSTE